MEAVLMNSTGDNKHRFKNPNRNFYTNRSLFPYPSDNLLYAGFLAGGHVTGAGYMSMPPVLPPASLSHPYLPAVSVFRSPQNFHQYRQQQPPLLPLPTSTPVNRQNTNIARSYSVANNNTRLSPPRINQINKNVKNRVRDHSLTPKKSKNQKKDSKKEVVDLLDLVPPATAAEKHAPPPEKCSSESTINNIIGPDPKKDSKKEVVDLIHPVTSEEKEAPPPEKYPTESVTDEVIGPDPNDLPPIDDVDTFSGSIMFTPSPPPSSLPLPTFFLRSKVSCKAEAAVVASGVDAGATDSLRRILRL